jgi:golgi-specific brefeldin A-resistance guanine nucleotide exchange factor 1
MTLLDFVKNLKGVNDSQDFAPEYLEAIFNAIRMREIIMPEEHDNQAGFDYAWKSLLQKAEHAGELTICTSNIYDSYMFGATWRPVVATLSYVFASATDDTVFKRVIAGLDQSARIAARYGLHDALDQIILCLAKICTLAAEDAPSTKLNVDVIVEENMVTVSELAVRFGRDFTGQLATVVLFSLCEGKEDEIRTGWKYVSHPILRTWLTKDCSDFGDFVCEWAAPEVVFAFGAIFALDLVDSTEG